MREMLKARCCNRVVGTAVLFCLALSTVTSRLLEGQLSKYTGIWELSSGHSATQDEHYYSLLLEGDDGDAASIQRLRVLLSRQAFPLTEMGPSGLEQAPLQYRTGSKVEVNTAPGEQCSEDSGKTQFSEICAASITPLEDVAEAPDRLAFTLSPPRVMKTITMILQMCPPNAPATTVQAVQSMWFKSALSNNTMDEYYRSCTYGRVSWPSSTNAVVGPIPVPCSGTIKNVAYSTSRCQDSDMQAWGDVADDYVTRVLKINMSQFNHRIYVLSKTVPCWWTGYGIIGCSGQWWCRVWVQGKYSGLLNAYTHELGHGLGLGHAGERGDTYSDYSCSMGYCCGNRCYNPAHVWQGGWSQPQATLSSTNFLSGVTRSIRLPAQLTSTADYIRVVPDWNPSITDNYYFSYRTRVGFDTALSSSYINAVNVYTYPGAQGIEFKDTQRVSLVRNGSLWRDPVSQLQIKVLTSNASQATMEICRFTQDRETNCGNGRDDDCDGKVDLNDLDCKGGGTSGGDSIICEVDGWCSFFENARNCPRDCPPRCGDRYCDKRRGENAGNCLQDCAVTCGDAVCSPGEDQRSCPRDCHQVCGDRVCSKDENAISCPADCPALCGDGFCTDPETPLSCRFDCPSVCGDGMCSRRETAGNCPQDCTAWCGDAICTHNETPRSCPSDCPAFCGDDMCTQRENAETCPRDCMVTCGDSVCSEGEDSVACPVDCTMRSPSPPPQQQIATPPPYGPFDIPFPLGTGH